MFALATVRRVGVVLVEDGQAGSVRQCVRAALWRAAASAAEHARMSYVCPIDVQADVWTHRRIPTGALRCECARFATTPNPSPSSDSPDSGLGCSVNLR